MTESTSTAPDVDWTALGNRLSDHMADMIHREDTKLDGSALYGEAMRRLVSQKYLNGLTTVSEADREREQENRVLRFNAEDGQRRAQEAEQKYSRLYQQSAWRRRYEAAQWLRSVATHQMSKYRREGWEQAIECLWPKDQPEPPELGE